MLGKIQDSLIKDQLDQEISELTAKLTECIKQRQSALGEGVKSSLPNLLPVCVIIIIMIIFIICDIYLYSFL